MNYKIYEQNGKKWKLPVVISFGFNKKFPGHYFYDVEYRNPKKGEWFLSGAIIDACESFSDLNIKYLVISNLIKAKKIESWVE